jgi:hypothetical protein
MTFRQPQLPTLPAYDLSVARVKPDVSTPARAKAVEIEDLIRADALETGVFIDQAGKVLFQRQGRPDRVAFKTKELYLAEGATFTHNHPAGTTLSFGASGDDTTDLVLAFTWGFAEVRAVTRNARHMARPIGASWPSLERLNAALPTSERRAAVIVKEMVRTDKLHFSLYDHEKLHQQLLTLATALGFYYQRESS